MCGIFAYLNYNVNRERRYILQVLFNGLRRLEYRGYDSSGISIDNSTSDPIIFSSSPSSSSQPPLNSLPLSSPLLVFRQEGNIESLVKSVYQGKQIKIHYFFIFSLYIPPLCLVDEIKKCFLAPGSGIGSVWPVDDLVRHSCSF